MKGQGEAAMGKIRVGVLFGGRSGEHEVSLMSAKSVIRYLDKSKYDVVPLGITREGKWLATGDPLKELQARADEKETPVVTEESCRELVAERRELLPGVQRSGIPHVDVVFPVLHGPYGEDGTLQGLLELADIAYVGAGVLGSALAMDKAAMKAVFRAEGLPIADYVAIMRWDWESNPTAVLQRIDEQVGCPCFVKPANLGSSVGITKVHALEELPNALNLASRYDRKLLVEVAVNAREIECSVLGNDQPIASLPGEVIPKREFYDYVAKYFDQQTQLIVPADLTAEQTTEIQELAVRAFLALDLAGMARADFFLCKDSGRVYVNELNSIPGFTHASMYPKMWEASGLSYPELLDRLIELALERHQDTSRRSVSHEAEVG